MQHSSVHALIVSVSVACCASLLTGRAARAEGRGNTLQQILDKYPDSMRFASEIGVTRRGTAMPCRIDPLDFDPHAEQLRVLLVGGLDGSATSVKVVLNALQQFDAGRPRNVRWNRFILSAVVCANPDGLNAGTGERNQSGGTPSVGYPPGGNAYTSPTSPEAQYLWRWVGMHAPDLVVDVRAGEKLAWELPAEVERVAPSVVARLRPLVKRLQPVQRLPAGDDFVSALAANAPSETAPIPALRVKVADNFVERLFDALGEARFEQHSPARQELRRRLARSPIEIASQLSGHYGQDLKQVAYIPALALVGRLRLGELTADTSHLADVERIVAVYRTGSRSTFPARVSGSNLSGHLVFGKLADLTGKKKYVDLVVAAANLGFDDRGQPLEAMPAHLEMSDSVFMGCPILASAGRLTGEKKYFDMCLRHLRFMRKHCLRSDGLYRHSPLDEAAWGRGNGFPALGLALTLTDFPLDHPGRGEILKAYRDHLQALARHQDPTGTWHQVIDRPESYREFTSTCMIAFAIARGVRSGWLDGGVYNPILTKAWAVVKTRIGNDDRLVDVCTGTGKQKNLRAYYDRTAILGPDARGGAMALMAATEIAYWQKERAPSE